MFHSAVAAVEAAQPPQTHLNSRSRKLILVFWLVFAIDQLVDTAAAQNRTTNATTDPSEARILKSIFKRWGISATNQWNISGKLCSGVAIDETELQTINPGIKCDCFYNNNSTCHITSLRVSGLDVAGPIPEELWNLSYLTDLDLRRNYLTGPLSASIGNLTRMQNLSLSKNALSGELPRELGLLTELRYLSFGVNNFSGLLPSELGNLSKLRQL